MNLFNQLMQLSEASESFYFSDMKGEDNALYRIFLYRLGSYSEFLLPSALESRGTMYRQLDNGEWRLVCRPFTKFFNWKENPFTMNLDFSKAQTIMVKEDGSLISTYLDANGILQLKSKGSVKSEQVFAARAWLNNHPDFEALLYENTATGFTVNCEWTSPLNRIVESYSTEKLTVLGAREMSSGMYVSHDALVKRYGADRVVRTIQIAPEDVSAMPTGEGVVVFFGNGASAGSNFTKIKTERYCTLHKLKDGVNNPNALFDAVLNEQVDDLKASFSDDGQVQMFVEVMESLVNTSFNQFCKIIRTVHSQLRDADRKTYAVQSKVVLQELLPEHQVGAAHSICMMKYLSKEYDYKSAFSKSSKSGIVDLYRRQIVSNGD